MRAKDIIGFLKPQKVKSTPALCNHDINDIDISSIKVESMIERIVEGLQKDLKVNSLRA
jgi:hypothetical protein